MTNRYERHFQLKEIGREGQGKLLRSRVLIVGAGGLGSPVALYLSAAGIGTVGIADFDTVEESNLQRQVIYGSKDIGRKKLIAATERIRDLNPEVKVVPHHGKLSRLNSIKVMKKYDVVVDCTDNIPSRYLVNDASHLAGIPDVYGSVQGFQGQATLFGYEHGPCYRCLYHKPPELSPKRAAVIGVLPGIVGNIQALEVIKVLLGIGNTLSGRLLLVDALPLHFRELRVARDPHCPLCGHKPTIAELSDRDSREFP